MGPVEYLVVEFAGNQFKGELVPALAELINNDTIRVLDLVFIKKDAEGDVAWFDFDELDAAQSLDLDQIDADVVDLLNEEDIAIEAELLDANSSAAVVVFENVWATRLRDAVVNANGRIVDNARVPAAIVEEAMAAAGIDAE